jgi:ribosomal protein L11 methyltransferase
MAETLTLILPASAVPLFSAALDPFAAALNVFEEDEGEKLWSIRAVLREDAAQVAIDAALSLAAAASGHAPQIAYAPLEERDWLEATRQSFPPLRRGRFLIHGSHYTPAAGEPGLRLHLDAATAFGSGEHPTTQGCLAALEEIFHARRVSSVLDMGCGSGILSVAAARLWPKANIVAIDIDPESVRVARHNAKANHVALRAVAGNGYRTPLLARMPGFDIIVANILAGPLKRMAFDLSQHLAPGGAAILSGLLKTQEQGVLAAHRAHHLKLVARFPIGEWQTLVLKG